MFILKMYFYDISFFLKKLLSDMQLGSISSQREINQRIKLYSLTAVTQIWSRTYSAELLCVQGCSIFEAVTRTTRCSTPTQFSFRTAPGKHDDLVVTTNNYK